jgi:hypothetical protein
MRNWVSLFAGFALLVSASGCGRIDTQKGIADCRFEAAKATSDDKHRDYIIFACMLSKGYELSNDCFSSSIVTVTNEVCWKRTWRVVQP